MKLADARENYYTFSASASDVGRKLAFAGIAIIWLFSGGTPANASKVVIDHDLRWPAILFTAGLTLDLLHYVWGSAAWGAFTRCKERHLEKPDEDTFLAPPWINYPTLAMFWVKLGVLVAGYGVLLDYLAARLLK